MNYDFDRLFHVIVASVSASDSLTSRMHAVIDECERQRPHPDWALLKAYDYEVDVDRIQRWVRTTPNASQLSAPPRGLWIGICTPCDIPQDLQSTRSDVYLSLCANFDASNSDWAYESLVISEYMNSEVLRTLYRQAYGTAGGLGNAAEYPLALAYGAMIAAEAVSGPIPNSLKSLEGVACGFDSGDALFVGVFENGAFRKYVKPL